ncbi:MAG: hypothetical protein ABFC84_16620 [Veillonellales bacterium]
MEKKNVSQKLCNGLLDSNYSNVKDMVGKLLTIVDSVINDPVQRKATKDMVEDVAYYFSVRQQNSIRYFAGNLCKVLGEENLFKLESVESNPLA